MKTKVILIVFNGISRQIVLKIDFRLEKNDRISGNMF